MRQILGIGLVVAIGTGSLLAGVRSDSKVKITAQAGKVDAAGKQTVVLTLAIDKTWHIYANPVDNEDLAPAATTVTVKGGAKPGSVKIAYPKGQLYKDVLGESKVYEDRVEIPITLERSGSDPLEIFVRLQACNKDSCLQTATVKVTVP